MDSIRQQFLNEAILKLETLLPELSDAPLHENLRREIFRVFHTLKGTAQTLSINVVGKLAHELENLLYTDLSPEISNDREFVSLLREGIEILLNALYRSRGGEENVFPHDFVQKLQKFLPDYSASDSEFFLDNIPADVFGKLSVDEKKSLRASLADGKNFYSVEVEFSLSDFDRQFRSLHKVLQDQHEIIATFPKPDISDTNKIGFRIFSVSRFNADETAELTKPFNAGLTSYNSETNFSNDLQGILKHTISAGKKVAQRLEKKVEFETTENVSKIPKEYLTLLSECLLHLVRNAVDHAIDKSGTIKVEVVSEKNLLIVRVSDDGRGLDAEKIKTRAIKKNLIAANENLSREETFDLIFAHGFSTAEKVSEISGRGVGLDIVRAAVEKSGGEIGVESLPGKGTNFEIRLPVKQ